MRIGEVYFSPCFRFIDLDPADTAGFIEALSVSCRRLGRERLICAGTPIVRLQTLSNEGGSGESNVPAAEE
jgi:hypothetical protein